MSNKKLNETERFLASLKITEFELFDDLQITSFKRAPDDPQLWLIALHKELAWEPQRLIEFVQALSNINYHYQISFTYTLAPQVSDALVLFDAWYSFNYTLPANLKLTATFDDIIEIHFAAETETAHVHAICQEFKGFLAFIGYHFPVLGRVQIIELSENSEDNVMALEDDDDIEPLHTLAPGEIATLDYQDVPPPDDADMPIELEALQARVVQDGSDYLQTTAEKNRLIMEEEQKRARLFKRGKYQPHNLREIDTNSGNVDFAAKVFSAESRPTKKGKIHTFGVFDTTGGAIFVKAIENNSSLSAAKLKEFKNGVNLRVRGAVGLDYDNSLMVMAHFLDILPPEPLRSDLAPEKRVELHLHTKLSALDGTNDIGDFITLAASMGHKAIALTDHGVVQAFPEAQTAAKGKNIKVLYGCEMYMIETDLAAVNNPAPIELANATYVVFDLETTGLSSKYDKIIEFGAVRVVKGMIQERIDILINPGPEATVSPKITRITNITPAMLVGKPLLKDALPKIIEFIGDAILVSHNSEFDIGFLNVARAQFGLGKVPNPIINTLPLSRYLFPNARGHRLGELARNLEVEYDTIRAHRGDYDAEVLNNIWQAMIVKFTNQNPTITHQDLLDIKADTDLYKHLYAKHVVVLAKNAEGLKDLYKLISLSHTEYLADVPKIPRQILAQYRSNLLIGSACLNGEVFETAMNRSTEQLEEVMKFYDYIEIQPPANYSFLINMDKIKDQAMLFKLLRDIMNAAKAVGKLVVATGDVHYLNPQDKVYRDVYIMAKGIGGVNHPLNPYDRTSDNRPIFENPDQHFRSTEEMLAAFIQPDLCTEQEALEIVVKNSNLIADACQIIMPIKPGLSTPTIENVDTILKDICYKKAHALYGDPLPDIVSDRLTAELNGIIAHGYSVIYYIAHKIIKKANEDGYMVGSRGSVGSSFVATMADITEVNPLKPHYYCPQCQHSEFDAPEAVGIYSGQDLPAKKCPVCKTKMKSDGQNIPFATFLGFNADKTPDIDLNFPGDYQSRAHDYTKVLLGEKNVFRAGTIETIQYKTAFGYVRGFFEKIGRDLLTIPRAEVAALAAGCVGVKKTTGQHPGGIVVVPDQFEVYDFTPIQYPANDIDASWKTTHFAFSAIHDNILKLDLLGHVDPLALKMMGDLTGINPLDIPLDDPKALSLFSSPKALKLKKNYLNATNGALALPEFGTPYVRSILDDVQPKAFADLVVISGISHGKGIWFGNADDLIRSKKAKLHELIGCRDDIMMYLLDKKLPSIDAFQIMEDTRKGKQLTPSQVEKMLAHNVPQYYIDSCNKIEYMFPKAHATAYVMMAVRVGWYKIHYPLEFYATFFSVRSDQYDLDTMIKGASAIEARLAEYQERKQKTGEGKMTPKEIEIEKTLEIALEMVDRGLKISNIDLYRSDATRFTVDKINNAVIPPFLTIDGLGEAAAQSVIEARKAGEFISIEDLLERTKLNSQNIEKLQLLGVLKDLPLKNQMNIFDFL